MDEVKIKVDAAVDSFIQLLDGVHDELINSLTTNKLKGVGIEEMPIHRARIRTVAALIKVGKVYQEGGGLPSVCVSEAGDDNNLH